MRPAKWWSEIAEYRSLELAVSRLPDARHQQIKADIRRELRRTPCYRLSCVLMLLGAACVLLPARIHLPPFLRMAVCLLLVWDILDMLRTMAGVMRAQLIAAGICRRCGYDLTGNTSGVCPECGTVIV